MSLHSIRPETEAALARQRRTSFITSAIISILMVILLLLILSIFLLAPLFKETPTIVTYESSDPTEETELETKVMSKIQPKPPSSSSSMARVIAANTTSPTAVPVTDVEVETITDGFGFGDDFGDGWGSGSGTGGGASFFNQKVKANRIAYVIDYSGSMRGDRERLMRKELSKSVEALPPGMQYQLLFFAGPTWIAGNDVAMTKDRKSAIVKDKGFEFKWTSNGGAHDWKQKGRKLEATWLDSSSSQRKKSLKLVKDTHLVYGTDWEPALEMAMAMDPPPQVIFFMTDGVTGPKADSLARRLGAKAKTKNIVINTVALMEPRAEKAMKDLAKRTKGEFTLIEKNGKARTGKIK